MGKAPKGLMGPVSGKVGNHVFYVVNGETNVRSLPSERTGKKTLREKSNTSGFAKVQAFLRPVKLFLKVGFKDYGTVTGGYRAAVSYALKNAVRGEYPDQYIDPALVRVCGGDLHFPLAYEIVLEPGNVLRFNWSQEIGDNGNPYDQIFMLAYKPADEVMVSGSKVGVSTGALRLTGTDSLQLSAGRKPQEYHVYMGFIAKDRSCQSPSQYMGKVLVPAK
jgi:hypothetical protein